MKTPTDMIAGTYHDTNNYGALKVLRYSSKNCVLVRFTSTGYVTSTSSGAIRKGKVKDKIMPSIYGVGYFGDGEFKSHSNGKKTDFYRCWSRMMERCYSDRWHIKNPTYKGCFVCDEWHNFQTFAMWYMDNHPKDGNSYDLDKDKLIKGNRTYKPEACSFITRCENSQVSNSKEYKVKSPDGEVIKLSNLSDFCRKNGLTSTNMNKVILGKRKSHKGWTSAK